jgi:phosphocarrier protein HPr
LCSLSTSTVKHSGKLFSKVAIINNELGLHARPAGMIAKLAANAKADIYICKNENQADASSIIDILTLACSQGSKVTVKIDNMQDVDILDRIIDLIEKGFGE